MTKVTKQSKLYTNLRDGQDKTAKMTVCKYWNLPVYYHGRCYSFVYTGNRIEGGYAYNLAVAGYE